MSISSVNRLRIGIEAQIVSAGSHGGVEQALIGLFRGLAAVAGDEEEYLMITSWEDPEWPRPFLGPNQRIVVRPRPQRSWWEKSKAMLGPMRAPAGRLKRALSRSFRGQPAAKAPGVPISDGFWEDLNLDVLHISSPLHFFRANVPTVFTNYDLQHRHYPRFFTTEHIAWREVLFPAAFTHSRAVVCICDWVRDDTLRQYAVDPHKLYVAHLSSPVTCYENVTENHLASARKRVSGFDRFMLFPALTYEHKNHCRLLEAMALIRDKMNMKMNLICTGQQIHHWPEIKRRMDELDLHEQIRFLGFVPKEQLRALYRLAEFLVLPTLFEGAGLPLLEGFGEGLAITCADIPAFREYGGAAALFFDPTSIDSIADAIKRMRTEPELRRQLREAGLVQSRRFSWEQTARIYQAIYRKVAGKNYSEEDRSLLNDNPAPSPVKYQGAANLS